MPKFKLQKSLPSCRVDKELLEKIETYLNKKAKELAGEDSFDEGNNCLIKICDDFGIETVESVSELSCSQFLDSTTEIQIDLNLWNYRGKSFPLEVNIRFHKDRAFSTINISYSGIDPRSTVVGIHDGITRIILTAKNHNHLFNPTPFIDGCILAFNGMQLLLFISIEKSFPNLQNISFLFSMFIFAYMLVGKKLKPYTAFDTPATERNAKLVDWFIYGLLSFLVFGSLFAAFRKKLFGF